MKRHNIDRRGFLKLAGASGAAITAGVTGLPSPLKASKAQEAKKGARFLKYDRGTYTPNFCEMCFWACGVDVYTRDGKIHKLEGNKLNPNNWGTLCAKGNAGIASTYDPDRIKTPLIRVGKRGEGKFRKATWEEAFDEVYKRLNPIIKVHGGKTIATFIHGTGEKYVHDLSSALGTPNITVPAYSQCRGSRAMGWALTFGGGVSPHETYDMAYSKHMMLFGRNMAGSIQVREAADFAKGLANGSKLTYIDPRLSESAANATDWLQINPGTDLALALGFIHVIIRDNLAEMKFVRKYCYGYNELSAHVKQYTPEWAAEKTGIDAATIERIAWDFAKDAPNVVAMPPRRVTRYGNDTQMVRAIAIINSLMGSWGVPGGIFDRTGVPPGLPKYERPHHSTEQRADGAGKGGKYSFAPTNLGLSNAVYKATKEQKPYPIKAWIMYGTNPLGHSAAGDAMEGIKNLDLIIAIDTQFTSTVNYADIILPESTYLERDDAPQVGKDKTPFIALRKAAIKPLHDTKGCFDICKGIAEKFGVEKYFQASPKKRTEDVIATLDENQKQRLEKDGTLLFEDAEPYSNGSGGTPKLTTTTGKAQLYCPDLEEAYKEFGDAFSPMPIYTDPEMPKADEFRMLFGRTPHHSHVRTQNNPVLLELQDSSPIWMHPEDAKKLRLKDGQNVKLLNTKTGFKSNFEKLNVTKRIKQGCVFVHYGFGRHTKQMNQKGIDTQYFVSNGVDPISGAAAFHNGFVKVVKG